MTGRETCAAWAFLFTVSCGGAAPPPEAATPTKPPSSSEGADAPKESVPEGGEGEAKDEPAPEPNEAADAKAPPAGEEDKSALKGRDVTYRPGAGGLVIEVEGVRLAPKAEPVQKGGGWALNLAIDVKGTDSNPHRLLRSKRGPLMIAGEVDRGGGKKERFTDERDGDAEEMIAAKGSADFEQRVDKVVYGGQSLTLHVGLWGLGRGDEERRPLKKLFIVRMVPGAKKPAAVISPPE